MSRIPASLAALLLAVTAGCNALEPTPLIQPTQRTLLVQPHLVECTGEGFHLCLLVRTAEQPEFLRHYGGIEGFTYEWGHHYEIEFVDHPVANPPADGSSIRTVLRRINSRQRVEPGTEFEIFLTAGDFRVREIAPDHYRFYETAEFACPEGAACAGLRTHISAGARIRYRFRHPAAASQPLTVVEWEACERTLAGSNRCRS
jgi:hypothetical protein